MVNSSTGLSRSLSSGEIDPREILLELNFKLGMRSLNDVQLVYLNEVKRQMIMREFARSALEVQTYKVLPGARQASDANWLKLYNGDTGIPILDACVKDLKAGLPHNRARLLLAREAIRRYNVDPQIVSDWFKENLKDYSPVINTFNIVVAASGINAGEPYFRRSNPFTAAKKLDPDGAYISRHGFATRFKPSESEQIEINAGSQEWLERWKKLRESESSCEVKKLWPTQDIDKGIYFIKNQIRANGSFAPYFNSYINQEDYFIDHS